VPWIIRNIRLPPIVGCLPLSCTFLSYCSGLLKILQKVQICSVRCTLPGLQVLERPSTWLSGTLHILSILPAAVSSWFTVSRQCDAGHPSYYDVTGRQNINFAVAGPRVWNSLPPAIRDPSLSLSVFGKLLKTYLFKGRGAGDL